FCFRLSAPSSAALYALSLHDALPISPTLGDPSAVGPVGNSNAAIAVLAGGNFVVATSGVAPEARILSISGLVDTIPISAATDLRDRKSTRLNSSHVKISYAVFCLKKK